MNFRVKYDELGDTGKFISQKNEEINKTFDNIQKLIDNLPNAWKGEDSEIFIKNASSYMKEQKEKNKKVEVLGEIISIVSGNYQNKDKEWEDRMKKERKVDDRN